MELLLESVDMKKWSMDQLDMDECLVIKINVSPPVHVRPQRPEKVTACVDHEDGQVSFYDTDGRTDSTVNKSHERKRPRLNSAPTQDVIL